MQLSFPGLAPPRDLIEQNHYTGRWPAGKSIVYAYEDAIVVIGIPANFNISKWLGCRVWELTRLWAPDGHRANLLTQAIAEAVCRFKQRDLADALIAYADPNVGHTGGVYRAASWVPLGQSEETRAYRDQQGRIVARRAFHSGADHLVKAEIIARGYVELRLPGKLRFVRPLNRAGKRAASQTPLTNIKREQL